MDCCISHLSHKKTANQEIDPLFQLNDRQLFDQTINFGTRKPFSILQQIRQKIEYLSLNSVNRRLYYVSLSVYYNNLAYFHHQNENYLEAEVALENSVKNFESIRGFINSREENVTFLIQLVKKYFQICAILSQGGNHQLSYHYAQKSLQKIIEAFRILKGICQDEKNFVDNHQPSNIKVVKYTKNQKIYFQIKILQRAQKLLKELSLLPIVHRLCLEEKHLLKVIDSLYYWKCNEEINEKKVKKQLHIDLQPVSRNILGLVKINEKNSQFQIGSLMVLRKKKLQFSFISDTYTLLSQQNIHQMILYASVCYFTLATQIRFTYIEEDMESLKIVQKYKRLTNDTEINKCKILHMKALEIAGKYVPEADDYFHHLLYSLNKNYKQILHEIKQVDENSTFLREKTDKKDFTDSSYEYGLKSKFRTEDMRNVSKEQTKSESKTKHKKKRKKSTKKQKCYRSTISLKI